MEESPHVLVVDDDSTLCGLLEYKLKRKGFKVTLCGDGQAAMEELQRSKVDVLLLDIMMPRMDGFHLLRVLQDPENVVPRAIVVLSARGDEDDILKAFELGAIDYVTKPFSVNVLIARIEIALKFKVTRG
ncbi:response regulator [bacterium]|nr:response regulator [bacterium]